MSLPYREFRKYLTADTRAENWLLYCVDAGCTVIEPGTQYPPNLKSHPPEYRANLETGRVIGEFQLVYITRGRGFFRSEGDSRSEVSEGTVFLLFPGVWHSYAPDPQTGWDEYWVGFKGSYADQLRQNGILNPRNPVYPVGWHASIEERFSDIFQVADQELPGFQLELASLVFQLLTQLHCILLRQQTSNETQKLVERARLLMQHNVMSNMETDSLLEELSVSYSTLLSAFKHYTGLSPYQYFLQLKVHKARELLQDASMSVKEVSHRLAFDNQYYFSRIFKRKTGMSPSDWQRAASITEREPGRNNGDRSD